MSGFPGSESLLLVNGDDVVGWSPEAERLLRTSADRMPRIRVPDLLDPWPGASETCTSPWTARLRGTGGQVRCRLLPVLGAGAADCLLGLLAEKEADHLDQDAALLQALFTQAKVGLAVHDAELRVTRVSLNEQFGPPSRGSMVEPSGGHPLAETLVAQDAAEIEVLLRRVLETGEAMVEVPHRARSAEQPLTDRIVSLSAIPLSGPDGCRSGVVVAFTDITAEHRQREGRFLAGDAARRIGADLDPEGCARELVEVLVPAFADAVAVDLAEPVLSGEDPDDSSGETGRRRVATLGRCERLPEPEDGTASVGALSVAGPPGGTGVYSLLAGGLQARGRTLGRVLMQRAPERLPFDAFDEEIAEEIVTRAALSIDNARRFVHECRSAATLQRSLAPPSVEGLSAADLAYLHLPSVVPSANRGAWTDAVPLSSARVAFVAGTTAARGVSAAAAAGRLRTAIQTLSDLDLAPEEVLTHVDELVRRLSGVGGRAPFAEDRDAGAGEVGATCLYAVYDPVTGHCAIAGAGHRAPVLVRPGGEAVPVRLEPRPPLGREGLPYEAVEMNLEPGTVLLFLAGDADVPAGKPAQGAGGVDAELHGLVSDAFSVCRATGTDGAALAARVRRLTPEHTAQFRFPADPSAVADARKAVTRTLDSWELDHLAFTTELVASELVTNAIRYAGAPVDLRLILDRSLICEVSDPSQTQPHLRHARLMDEGGRGLFLVHQLTQQWGSRYTSEGKTIWTAQQIDAPAA